MVPFCLLERFQYLGNPPEAFLTWQTKVGAGKVGTASADHARQSLFPGEPGDTLRSA